MGLDEGVEALAGWSRAKHESPAKASTPATTFIF